MKILYVSNLYGDNARGGAERIVELEARAMLAAGHEVTVLRAEREDHTPSHAPATPHEHLAPGPHVVGYTPPNLYFYSDDHKHGVFKRLAWHILDTFNGRSARMFAALLDAEQPDVVHTHNLMGLGFLIPAAIRRAQHARRIRGQKPLRHVHTVHDVQLLHPSGLLSVGKGGTEHEAYHFAGAMQAVYIVLLRMLMGSPDEVLFPSIFLRSLHEQRGFFRRSHREVLSNPAPAVVERASSDATRVPTAPQKPHFLFVGQIELHKGVMILADAWVSSGLGAQQATLAFAGDGVKMRRLRDRLEGVGGTEILGKLHGDALTAQYDRATFVVVPSMIIENQPTVILEAFSRGVPVVASVSGGIPEMVRENETGFLCAAGDAKSLSAALQKAAALSAADYVRLSGNAKAWASAHGHEAHVAGLRRAYGAAA